MRVPRTTTLWSQSGGAAAGTCRARHHSHRQKNPRPPRSVLRIPCTRERPPVPWAFRTKSARMFTLAVYLANLVGMGPAIVTHPALVMFDNHNGFVAAILKVATAEGRRIAQHASNGGKRPIATRLQKAQNRLATNWLGPRSQCRRGGECTAPGKPVEVHGSVSVYRSRITWSLVTSLSTRALCQSEKALMLAATSIIDC